MKNLCLCFSAIFAAFPSWKKQRIKKKVCKTVEHIKCVWEWNNKHWHDILWQSKFIFRKITDKMFSFFRLRLRLRLLLLIYIDLVENDNFFIHQESFFDFLSLYIFFVKALKSNPRYLLKGKMCWTEWNSNQIPWRS